MHSNHKIVVTWVVLLFVGIFLALLANVIFVTTRQVD